MGLLWDDDHVAQGFAWDEEFVAFGIPDHNGQCLLEVDPLDHPEKVEDAALWAIEVPFATDTGELEVGTILITRPIKIPKGKYALTFSVYPGFVLDGEPYAYKIRLAFSRSNHPEFAIRKKGKTGIVQSSAKGRRARVVAHPNASAHPDDGDRFRWRR